MTEAARLHLARSIAAEAHAGQLDKTGRPYVEHCMRVADAVDSEDEKIVAFLHDVVEKTGGWTLQRLEDAGFEPAVVAAVDALTRRSGESEEAFLHRSTDNSLSRPVKIADLEDNLAQAVRSGRDASKFRNGLKWATGPDGRARRGRPT